MLTKDKRQKKARQILLLLSGYSDDDRIAITSEMLKLLTIQAVQQTEDDIGADLSDDIDSLAQTFLSDIKGTYLLQDLAAITVLLDGINDAIYRSDDVTDIPAVPDDFMA